MKLYTQGAVARIKKVGLKTVWRWCRDGKIPTEIFTIVQASGKEIQYPYITEEALNSLASK